MHIVLALDSSEDAKQSIRFLAKLPFRVKPKITMVTALVDIPLRHVASETGLDLREVERDEAHRNYEQAKSQLLDCCSDFEHVIEREHPSRLIFETAKSRAADLIVLGARGHSAAYRVMLGSTADYLVNHAKCPVLVVRRQAEQVDHSSARPFKVLVAFDASPLSQVALAQAESFSWPKEEAAIQIAMLLERPTLIPDDVVYDPEWAQESHATIAALKGQSPVSCPITGCVKETLHIGNELRGKILNEKFDLLFVGGSGKSALSRMVLGSTSRYLLHQAECSIWIAREKQW